MAGPYRRRMPCARAESAARAWRRAPRTPGRPRPAATADVIGGQDRAMPFGRVVPPRAARSPRRRPGAQGPRPRGGKARGPCGPLPGESPSPGDRARPPARHRWHDARVQACGQDP